MELARHSLLTIAAGLLRSLPPEERVLAGWAYACGTVVAERARAERFEHGVLYVEVAGREWTELAGLKGAYLSKLRQLTGVAVDDISFALEKRR